MQNKRIAGGGRTRDRGRGRRRNCGRGLLGAATLLLAPLLSACGSDNDDGVVLSFYTAADGAEQYAEAAANCSAASNGAYRVEQKTLPKGADDQRLQLAPASDRQ